MMNESDKEVFRWKFWHMALILNGIILMFAVAVLSFFIIPDPYGKPICVVSFVCGILLAVYFRGKYEKTKLWLDEHSD